MRQRTSHSASIYPFAVSKLDQTSQSITLPKEREPYDISSNLERYRNSLLPKLVLFAAGFTPIGALTFQIMEIAPIYIGFLVLVLPAAIICGILAYRQPYIKRLAVSGLVGGLIATSAYDIFRLSFVLAGVWGDFIPHIGTYLGLEERYSGLAGYLWRFIGNGGGMAVAFVVLQTFLPKKWDRRLLGTAYGVFVCSCLFATLFLVPWSDRYLFPKTLTNIALALGGHLIYGFTLGLFIRRRYIEHGASANMLEPTTIHPQTVNRWTSTPVSIAFGTTLSPLGNSGSFAAPLSPQAALAQAITAGETNLLDLLEQAGNAAIAQGKENELYALLQTLPPEIKDTEHALYWQLMMAKTPEAKQAVIGRVKQHLQLHESPRLRAGFAASLGPTSEALEHAQRAALAEETAFTLHTWGNLLCLHNPVAGSEVLAHAVRLAKNSAHGHELARTATSYAAVLLQLGQYQDAERWSDIALEQHKILGQSTIDEERARTIWVTACLLQGKTEWLSTHLDVEQAATATNGTLSSETRALFAQYLLVRGETEAALMCRRAAWEQAGDPSAQALHGVGFVRALIEVGLTEEALHVAERVQQVLYHAPANYRRYGLLARGIALSYASPEQAEPILRATLAAFSKPINAPELAQAALHLARLLCRSSRTEEAKQVLIEVSPALANLAPLGLAMLIGPAQARHDLHPLVGIPLHKGFAAPLH